MARRSRVARVPALGTPAERGRTTRPPHRPARRHRPHPVPAGRRPPRATAVGGTAATRTPPARPASETPDTDGLGLADLLAGALAAYRGI